MPMFQIRNLCRSSSTIGVFMMAVFPLAMSIPGMLVFGLYQAWKFKKVVGKEVAIYLAGWIAIASVMAIPGVDFVTWFLD